MPETERIQAELRYPPAHVKDPIIHHLVADYRLIPNIHRARIDAHAGGTLILHLEGARADLDAGLAYLRGLGVSVVELEA